MLICDHLKIIIYTSLFPPEGPEASAEGKPKYPECNTIALHEVTPTRQACQHAKVVHFTEVNLRFSTVRLPLRCFFTLWRHFEPELFRDLAMMCMKSRMELSDLGELS